MKRVNSCGSWHIQCLSVSLYLLGLPHQKDGNQRSPKPWILASKYFNYFIMSLYKSTVLIIWSYLLKSHLTCTINRLWVYWFLLITGFQFYIFVHIAKRVWPYVLDRSNYCVPQYSFLCVFLDLFISDCFTEDVLVLLLLQQALNQGLV